MGQKLVRAVTFAHQDFYPTPVPAPDNDRRGIPGTHGFLAGRALGLRRRRGFPFAHRDSPVGKYRISADFNASKSGLPVQNIAIRNSSIVAVIMS